MAVIKVFASILIFCCIAAIQAAPRVIGGSDAPNGKYPYVVSFRSRGSHVCGGSIISNRWILTAAHCVSGVGSNGLTVVVGSNEIKTGGKAYKVEYTVAHEGFHYQLFDPDVGLIRVAEDIEFSKKVKPVELPSENFSKVNYSSIFAGWGSTKLGGLTPNKLQEIPLNVISQGECKARWAELMPGQKTVTDGHVCTLNKAGQGICHGDSGSPLVADGVQVGLASYVTPCALGNPDVFTRVYTYVDWISKQMKKYEDSRV